MKAMLSWNSPIDDVGERKINFLQAGRTLKDSFLLLLAVGVV